MKYLYKVIFIALIGLVLSTIQVSARTIYVPASCSIKDSLDVASSGDTVLVGPGTFYERFTWPDVDGIVLISEFGPDSTIIDGSGNGKVIYFDTLAITHATKAKGFTITNGGNTWGGAGIRIRYGAAPTIENNLIKDNECDDYGAGIYIESSDPIIRENIIKNNHVTCISATPTHYGGGIFCAYSNALIEDNIIRGNKIENGGNGAGIALYGDSSIVQNNWIEADTAISLTGGGIYLYNSEDTIIGNVIANNSGNGIYASSSDLCVIKDNRIESNTAKRGGGICLSGSDADIIGNSIIANIADDDAGGWGGGIYITSCAPLVEDNVIARNIAEAGSSGDGAGGGIFPNSASGVIINRNTIVLNRAEGSSGMGGGMRDNLSDLVVGTTFADRNNIYHNFAADGSNIRSGWFSFCNATHNYWGTSDSTKISATIVEADWYPFETLPLPVEKTVSDTGFYAFGEVEMDFSSLTLGSDSTVEVTVYGDSVPPYCTGTKHISKFFDLQGNFTFNAYFGFYYTDDEFSASMISFEDSIDAYRYNGASWVLVPGTVDTAENIVIVNSSEFSVWMLAEDISGVGVDERESAEIMNCELKVYPNPFSTTTAITLSRYQATISNSSIARSPDSQIALNIYDLSGRLISSLPITDYRSPITEVTWDGRDMSGKAVQSGVYFLRMTGNKSIREPYGPVKVIKLR